MSLVFFVYGLKPAPALAHDGTHSLWDAVKKVASTITGLYAAVNQGHASIVRLGGGSAGVSNAVEFYQEYASHVVEGSGRVIQESQNQELQAGLRLPPRVYVFAP